MHVNWISAWTIQCTSCFKNATVFFEFLVNLCLCRSVLRHFTTIIDTVHYLPAVVTSCVFVRHLRWTWFEFSWLCFFPVTIATSTCMGHWDWFVDLLSDGGNYHRCEHMDAFPFHIRDVGWLLYCVFLSKTERYVALHQVLIAVCLSVRHSTRGVSINAVICKWHPLESSVFEWEYCLRYRPMQIIKVDLSAAFSCTVAEKAQEERCTVFVVHWGVMGLIWPEGNVFFPSVCQCSLTKPSSVTNLNNFASSTFFFAIITFHSALQFQQLPRCVCIWKLKNVFYDVCSNVRSESVVLGSYHMGQRIDEQFSTLWSWMSLQR